MLFLGTASMTSSGQRDRQIATVSPVACSHCFCSLLIQQLILLWLLLSPSTVPQGVDGPHITTLTMLSSVDVLPSADQQYFRVLNSRGSCDATMLSSVVHLFLFYS